jgi:hypothetical protein
VSIDFPLFYSQQENPHSGNFLDFVGIGGVQDSGDTIILLKKAHQLCSFIIQNDCGSCCFYCHKY